MITTINRCPVFYHMMLVGNTEVALTLYRAVVAIAS